MREIGSEFWNVPTNEYENGFFQDSCQWFLSGRSALQSIIKELTGCNTVALPSWCCDSMIKPFTNAGIDVSFYPVYRDNGIIQETDNNCDAVLLMDYFGYSGYSHKPVNYNGLVIRDVTHSIFSEQYGDADYYFGSLRKWCGVWTGGFAWASDTHRLFVENSTSKDFIELREHAMIEKSLYIAKSEIHRPRSDKHYLSIFRQAEEVLENTGPEGAAERDIRLAEYFDVESIKTKRRSNAILLMSALNDWLIFPELKEQDCPMFVPILIPKGKRNELRQYLIEKEIYCPVHWPISSYHVLDERERFIYDNELSLVCDQRYDENDMARIVEAINDFWKDVK